MTDERFDEDSGDDLSPAEIARDRRRDHDAAAGSRAGMRTGLAKRFKQVLDAQARRARTALPRRGAGGAGAGEPADEAAEDSADERPARKRGHRTERPVPPQGPD